MSVEVGLYRHLSTSSGVTDLVDTRIYPAVIPQGAALPAITYQQISGLRVHSAEGPSGAVSARFQVTCWAETYAEADGVAEAVRKSLDGFSGYWSGLQVYGVMLIDESDLFEAGRVPEESARFGKRLDFQIWHKEETS